MPRLPLASSKYFDQLVIQDNTFISPVPAQVKSYCIFIKIILALSQDDNGFLVGENILEVEIPGSLINLSKFFFSLLADKRIIDQFQMSDDSFLPDYPGFWCGIIHQKFLDIIKYLTYLTGDVNYENIN
jgi:hypothetical protein